MTAALARHAKREPLTWWRVENGAVRVVCSQGHGSMLQHLIHPDGSLVAPVGNAASLHCGTCNENLPLRLDGWSDARAIYDPTAVSKEVLPPVSRCDGCGTETNYLSGWTTCAQGLLCPKCWAVR